MLSTQPHILYCIYARFNACSRELVRAGKVCMELDLRSIITRSHSTLLLVDFRRQRIPSEQVYYHNSIEHRGGHLILSFSFCFDVEMDVYQFALSFPYSYSRSQALLNLLDEKKLPCYRRSCLALSVVLACS